MTSGRYAAVVFDLDDTVCRRTQNATALYQRAFDHAGIEPFGEPVDLWQALSGPPTPNAERAYFAAGFIVVAARHGRPDADPDALAEGLLASIDHGAVTFAIGAEAALAAANEDGPVGVLTNGPEWRQSQKLSALGVLDDLDGVVYAGDMARRKPHRDPFDRICSILGTEHTETLYVGDSLEHDVAGGQGAGLPVAWVQGTEGGGETDGEGRPDPDPFAPEHVLASLDEFERVLTDA
jgi:putative hydrolase of the HAD superfamily